MPRLRLAFSLTVKSPVVVTPVTCSEEAVARSRRMPTVSCEPPPTATEPKLNVAGESVTPGAVPVPVSAMTWVPTLSAIVTTPVRPPVAAGAKAICKVQLPPPAMVLGRMQSALLTAKSPPVLKLVTIKLLAPVLVSVTVWAPLVVPSV